MSRKTSDYYPERTLVDDIGSIIVNQTILASSVNQHIFTAPFDCRIVSIREIHSVVGGASAAVRPRKITDTSGPGAAASATIKELTTANFDLTATVNTTQVGTIVSTTTSSGGVTLNDFDLAAGDRLALNFAGTLTGLVGVITVHIKRI